jgi:hypothetical protein
LISNLAMTPIKITLLIILLCAFDVLSKEFDEHYGDKSLVKRQIETTKKSVLISKFHKIKSNIRN